MKTSASALSQYLVIRRFFSSPNGRLDLLKKAMPAPHSKDLYGHFPVLDVAGSSPVSRPTFPQLGGISMVELEPRYRSEGEWELSNGLIQEDFSRPCWPWAPGKTWVPTAATVFPGVRRSKVLLPTFGSGTGNPQPSRDASATCSGDQALLYSGSRRAVLRLRLRANACLTRSFWPGFR